MDMHSISSGGSIPSSQAPIDRFTEIEQKIKSIKKGSSFFMSSASATEKFSAQIVEINRQLNIAFKIIDEKSVKITERELSVITSIIQEAKAVSRPETISEKVRGYLSAAKKTDTAAQMLSQDRIGKQLEADLADKNDLIEKLELKVLEKILPDHTERPSLLPNRSIDIDSQTRSADLAEVFEVTESDKTKEAVREGIGKQLYDTNKELGTILRAMRNSSASLTPEMRARALGLIREAHMIDNYATMMSRSPEGAHYLRSAPREDLACKIKISGTQQEMSLAEMISNKNQLVSELNKLIHKHLEADVSIPATMKSMVSALLEENKITHPDIKIAATTIMYEMAKDIKDPEAQKKAARAALGCLHSVTQGMSLKGAARLVTDIATNLEERKPLLKMGLSRDIKDCINSRMSLETRLKVIEKLTKLCPPPQVFSVQEKLAIIDRALDKEIALANSTAATERDISPKAVVDLLDLDDMSTLTDDQSSISSGDIIGLPTEKQGELLAKKVTLTEQLYEEILDNGVIERENWKELDPNTSDLKQTSVEIRQKIKDVDGYLKKLTAELGKDNIPIADKVKSLEEKLTLLAERKFLVQALEKNNKTTTVEDNTFALDDDENIGANRIHIPGSKSTGELENDIETEDIQSMQEILDDEARMYKNFKMLTSLLKNAPVSGLETCDWDALEAIISKASSLEEAQLVWKDAEQKRREDPGKPLDLSIHGLNARFETVSSDEIKEQQRLNECMESCRKALKGEGTSSSAKAVQEKFLEEIVIQIKENSEVVHKEAAYKLIETLMRTGVPPKDRLGLVSSVVSLSDVNLLSKVQDFVEQMIDKGKKWGEIAPHLQEVVKQNPTSVEELDKKITSLEQLLKRSTTTARIVNEQIKMLKQEVSSQTNEPSASQRKRLEELSKELKFLIAVPWTGRSVVNRDSVPLFDQLSRVADLRIEIPKLEEKFIGTDKELEAVVNSVTDGLSLEAKHQFLQDMIDSSINSQLTDLPTENKGLLCNILSNEIRGELSVEARENIIGTLVHSPEIALNVQVLLQNMSLQEIETCDWDLLKLIASQKESQSAILPPKPARSAQSPTKEIKIEQEKPDIIGKLHKVKMKAAPTELRPIGAFKLQPPGGSTKGSNDLLDNKTLNATKNNLTQKTASISTVLVEGEENSAMARGALLQNWENATRITKMMTREQKEMVVWGLSKVSDDGWQDASSKKQGLGAMLSTLAGELDIIEPIPNRDKCIINSLYQHIGAVILPEEGLKAELAQIQSDKEAGKVVKELRKPESSDYIKGLKYTQWREQKQSMNEIAKKIASCLDTVKGNKGEVKEKLSSLPLAIRGEAASLAQKNPELIDEIIANLKAIPKDLQEYIAQKIQQLPPQQRHWNQVKEHWNEWGKDFQPDHVLADTFTRIRNNMGIAPSAGGVDLEKLNPLVVSSPNNRESPVTTERENY